MNGRSDFRAVVNALAGLGYRVGALVVDAKHFAPQSRPRLFILGISARLRLPSVIRSSRPSVPWHPDTLLRAWTGPSAATRRKWLWFDGGSAPAATKRLSDIVSDDQNHGIWHTAAETRRLLSLMSPINRRKLRDAKRAGVRMVATLFLRTPGERGQPAASRNQFQRRGRLS
jgi:DNA (cytosine-5)-methyltransferase 1